MQTFLDYKFIYGNLFLKVTDPAPAWVLVSGPWWKYFKQAFASRKNKGDLLRFIIIPEDALDPSPLWMQDLYPKVPSYTIMDWEMLEYLNPVGDVATGFAMNPEGEIPTDEMCRELNQRVQSFSWLQAGSLASPWS